MRVVGVGLPNEALLAQADITAWNNFASGRCATTNANSFDITTLQGLKLYRLRQAYDTNFGALNAAFSQPRYIKFGVRIFF